ncbi:hypothetical protein BN2476_170134 [Paraburkholderia piptadeniae]|uniref:Uncharacterized protein n=1 Tax=Paraburkholderia piptadeniae TaxID=1701573 RepID=A0A1N7RTK5_9BURK|nr:hypothetical protein BN2476_170134 [Paraburkholderia piptadeniae]
MDRGEGFEGVMVFLSATRVGFLSATLLVFLLFSLASALAPRGAGVAPVRGGTYFSLPPQRKVGKRKRAHTASAWQLPTGSQRPHPSRGGVRAYVRCQRSR